MGLRTAALALAALGFCPPALAFGFYGPPLSLPQTLRGTLEVPLARQVAEDVEGRSVDTLRDLFPALAACWREPDGLAKFERTEITARFSLRRDGSVIGEPRITFSAVPGDMRARGALIQAALEAIRRCTPAKVTPALGGAIAGRPLALRFIYHGPKGQGV